MHEDILEIERDPAFEIKLRRIEMPESENDVDPGGNPRHGFIFEARLGVDDGFFTIPITMAQPEATPLTELQSQAWLELYAILAQLAEVAREKADARRLVFPTRAGA
ncbi:MAG TPA: hypothetical protein VKQ29_05610 [Aliidongia sp.]|nr:hypothetical protein [Aliidongia sp.]